MKRILVFALLLLAVPISARADEASKRAKIEEVFALVHVDKLTQQMMEAAKGQAGALASQMMGSAADPDAKAKVQAFQAKLFDLIESQVGWKAMEPDYVKLYADTFTEAQLDDLLAFYKSPTGQVFIDKMPELTRSAMQLAMQKMMALQRQLKQMTEDFSKQVAKPKS